MIRLSTAITVFFLAACSKPSAPAEAVPAIIQRTALTSIHVIDVASGEVRRDQTILIEGDRIAAIVPAAEYLQRDGDVIRDMAGAYAMPGLVEMHAHLLTHPWREDGELSPQYDWQATTEMLSDLVKYGVTTVRDPGSSTEGGVQLRRLVAEGAVFGPEIKTAGRILTQSNFDSPYFAPILDEAAVAREIGWQAKNGVDFIKIYASMKPELFTFAVAEAQKHNLPVIAHSQRTTWTDAAKLGAAGLCHAAPWSIEYVAENNREGMADGMMGRVDWLDRVDLQSPAVTEMISEMATRGVYNDATLIAMHTKFFGDNPRWLQNPDLVETPPAFLAGWKAFSFTSGWTPEMYARAKASWPKLEAWVRALHDGGVMLTVGTDTPTPWIIPGVSMHDEMALLVAAGLSPVEVLRMATLNGAKALKMDDRIGALEAGKEADILIVGSDPTADIAATRDIRLVVMNGVARTPAEITNAN